MLYEKHWACQTPEEETAVFIFERLLLLLKTVDKTCNAFFPLVFVENEAENCKVTLVSIRHVALK